MQNLQCKAETEKRWMHVDFVSSKEWYLLEDELYTIQWRQSGLMIKMDENNDLFAPPLLVSVLACLLPFLPSVLPFLRPLAVIQIVFLQSSACRHRVQTSATSLLISKFFFLIFPHNFLAFFLQVWLRFECPGSEIEIGRSPGCRV